MTLTYHFGEDDLLCWYRYYYKSSASGKAARIRYIAWFWASFLGGAALAAFYYHWWVITLAAFAFAVLVSLLAPVAFDQHVEQQLRRSASDPTVRGSFGEHRLTLSDEGLREVTPAIESLAKWQSVTDVVVDNGHIYVRLASGQAAVINRLSYSGAIAFEQIPQVIHEYRQKHAVSYSPVSRIETALILTNSRMP